MDSHQNINHFSNIHFHCDQIAKLSKGGRKVIKCLYCNWESAFIAMDNIWSFCLEDKIQKKAFILVWVRGIAIYWRLTYCRTLLYWKPNKSIFWRHAIHFCLPIQGTRLYGMNAWLCLPVSQVINYKKVNNDVFVHMSI